MVKVERGFIVDDSWMVCNDCYWVISSTSYTPLDCFYPRKEADRRMEEINASLDEAPGPVMVGDSAKDDEFSTEPCECCGIMDAGDRHHCVVDI